MAERTTPQADPEARTRRLLVERIPVRGIILVVLSILLVVGVVAGSWATLTEGRLTGDDWTRLIVGGVTRGSVYAIIAVGYTLVYGILFLINFAHGEVFMAGAFSTLFVARALDQTGFLDRNQIVSIGILFLSSMLISMIVAIILERVAYRPLRGAPRLILLITAIGASLFLQNTFRGFFGSSSVAYPEFEVLSGQLSLLGVGVSRVQLVVIIGALILMVGLYLFIERTKTGRSMRAVGEDKEIAALMGIDVDRVIVTTFAIGGLLAGAAGILFVFVFNQVNYFMGFVPGIKAFTAAVLGGIGNILGAGIGGLALGILESVGPRLLLSGADIASPDQLQPVVAFGILVLVLIFRPGGILGSAEEARA
ncbi:MAG TPA: branched-chain amino acid ABC transporter permease [Actinomycetota bacterium]|nr:branched-chain amino acid ABC transporter permease [Actinomycetota bacterium]